MRRSESPKESVCSLHICMKHVYNDTLSCISLYNSRVSWYCNQLILNLDEQMFTLNVWFISGCSRTVLELF